MQADLDVVRLQEYETRHGGGKVLVAVEGAPVWQDLVLCEELQQQRFLLHQGELVTKAATRSCREREVVEHPGLLFLEESLRVEVLSFPPNLWVLVDGSDVQRNSRALRNENAVELGVVGRLSSVEIEDGRAHTEAFVDDSRQVRHVVQILGSRIFPAGQNLLSLFASFLLDLRILCEVVHYPSQRDRSGIVPGNEEDPKHRQQGPLRRQHSICRHIHTRSEQHVKHVLRLVRKSARCLLVLTQLHASIYRTLQDAMHVMNRLPHATIAGGWEALQERERHVHGVGLLKHDVLVVLVAVGKGAIDGTERLAQHRRSKHVQSETGHVLLGIHLVCTPPRLQKPVGAIVELGQEVAQGLLLEGGIDRFSLCGPLVPVRHENVCGAVLAALEQIVERTGSVPWDLHLDEVLGTRQHGSR